MMTWKSPFLSIILLLLVISTRFTHSHEGHDHSHDHGHGHEAHGHAHHEGHDHPHFEEGEEEPVNDVDVVVLGAEDFDDTIQKNAYVLVEFYAPWCGHCKALAPTYAALATVLKQEGSNVVVAKVDATVHEDLATKYNVQGYPTLKFFRNGVAIDYNGGAELEDILGWVKRKAGPPSRHLTSKKEIEDFIALDGTKLIAYIDADKGTKNWDRVATSGEVDDFVLGHVTDTALFEDNTANSFIIHKTGEPSVKYTDKFTKTNIVRFALEEGYPLVSFLAQPIWERSHAQSIPLVSVFIKDPEDAATMSMLTELAKKFKGKVYFSYHTSEELAERWGATGKVFPTAILVKWLEGGQTQFTIFNEEGPAFDLKTGEEFVTKGLTGEYAGFRKSEPIPEKNDGPVFVLVGKQFDEIVFDSKKDVFVEFYAPWCGHCQKLAPVWEELGQKFAPHKDKVVIAKMDATANAPSDKVEIQGFPTLLFFPADKKEGILYDGERDLEDLTKFVLEHSSHTINLAGTGSEAKTEL